MTTVARFASASALVKYRSTLSGERLGWIIYVSPLAFRPVHRVLSDPENGPVVIVGSEVLLVDEDAAVFATEEQAKEAYFSQS